MLKVPTHMRQSMLRMKQGAVGVADRMPVYGQMSHHSARLAGESAIAFFTDAETFLRCELAADELYGIDAPTIHYDVYNIESEALGAKLIWKQGGMPAIDRNQPLLSSVDDFKNLRPIKLGAAGRMPYVLEINRRLMDLGLPPKVRYTGLFTFAANLVGLENLILAIMARPERVHNLLRFLTHEVVAPWVICQREQSGSDETATGADALASPPLISVGMVREFCLKYVKELDQRLGKIRLAGLWGESFLPEPRELLDIKREGSINSIQVLDPDVSALGPAFFRRYADETGVGLVMGMDAHLIRTGPVTAIVSRARRFIEEAGINGGFILFMNDIPYDTPPEHVHAVVSVAREYHRDSSGARYVRQKLCRP